MLTVDVNDIDVDRCVRLKFGMLGYSKDRQFKANTEREYTLSLLLLLPLFNALRPPPPPVQIFWIRLCYNPVLHATKTWRGIGAGFLL